MIRTLNVLAIAALIGSATVAYSVKYETILVAEKLKKREAELQREKDALAVLKAEWQLLNRPSRLAGLARPEAGLQPLAVRQIVRADEVPIAKPENDPLARQLDGLLTGSIGSAAATPRPKSGGQLTLTPRPAPRQAAVSATPRPAGAASGQTRTQPLPRAATAKLRPPGGGPTNLRPPAPVPSTAAAPARPDLITRTLGLLGFGRDSKPRP